MLKPVTFTESQVGETDPAVGLRLAKKVFRIFHASYGNLFLSKYQTGQLDPQTQRDKGVETAMIVWGAGLAKFTESVVTEAVERAEERHPEFPPTRGQFLALCRACQPAEVYQPAVAALPMDAKLRSAYAAQAREINQRHNDRKAAAKVAPEIVPGLGGLFAAIANAAACGGEDEAVALRRLETSMAARPSAGEAAA